MKPSLALLLSLVLTVPTTLAAQTDFARETQAQRDARMAWWREARFGMFIHWGAYAVPAGAYRGERYARVGEWIMDTAGIPIPEYEQLVGQGVINVMARGIPARACRLVSLVPALHVAILPVSVALRRHRADARRRRARAAGAPRDPDGRRLRLSRGRLSAAWPIGGWTPETVMEAAIGEG